MSQILYPTTNLAATETLILERAQGIYVYDKTGKEYIEGMAGLWCASLGYGHEELIETIQAQYRTLSYSHMFGGKTHPTAIALADKLSDMVNIPNAKVFFGHSGSDANDSLLKLIRYYNQVKGRPEKYKIISRKNAYHGVTLGAASITGLEINHSNFDLPTEALGVLRVDVPHFYRHGLTNETESAYCDRLIAQIEQVIEHEGAHTIAALIAEPIIGAGGVITPPANYFPRLQALLKQHDILFMDDEVICAFGRTGADFGATTYDLRPDTMTLAKGLSAAYFPISASVISAEIYEQIEKGSNQLGMFGHGFTYSGHPIGCATALKALEIYERDDMFAKAKVLGDYLHKALHKAFNNHPNVGQIRGKGLIAGIQFMQNSETKTFFADKAFVMAVQRQCEQNGLIVRGIQDNTLAICPPLIITQAQIDQLVSILTESVNQVVKP